jgi:uncharacterized protein (TIGR00255 family)
MSQSAIPSPKKAECFSMTGYAHSRVQLHGWALRVAVKSVNHRFLDLKLRMPEGFDAYELRLRQIVREHIHRGHVEVTLNVQADAQSSGLVNNNLVHAYLRAAESLRQLTSAATSVDLVGLLRLPVVVGGSASVIPESEDEQEKLGLALDDCLRAALTKLDDMRRTEGLGLVEDLRARLQKVSADTEKVRELAVAMQPAFARRLDAKLKEMLGGMAMDPSRLAQEAALLAQRGDISEELDRLGSHVVQFGKLLDGAGELGKKLDFLLQEMHREANTMLSKTPGAESEALAITGLALELKAEIEKLREQVQNLE